MKIRIVTTEGVQEIESTDPIAALEIRGFEVVGLNQNKMQRIELQGAPLIKGLCGPMWDGNAIRYECAQTNEQLSA